MARIPTRLAGPAQVATGPATIITAAAGEKNIIRHIHVYNPGAGTVLLTLSIGADAAATRIFDNYPIAEDVPFDHFCYYILDATQVLQAAASVNNQLVITIDGEVIKLG